MRPPTPNSTRTFDGWRELHVGELHVSLAELRPLWRVIVPIAMTLVLVGMQLTVRMWSSQTTAEIRSTTMRLREAETAREQLELELAIRRGHAHLQRAALVYGLVPPGTLVDGAPRAEAP